MNSHKVFVGCCVAVLNPAGDKVLVSRRKVAPDVGGLQLPGGTIDYGDEENARNAAIREVKEETGLDITEVRFLCVMNTTYYGLERPIKIAFVGKSSTEELPPNPEPHKSEDWHWIELHNLPEDNWFRMSKIAIDFLKKQLANPTIEAFVVDEVFDAPSV